MNDLKIKDVIEIPAVKPNLVVKVGEINSEQKRQTMSEITSLPTVSPRSLKV